MVILAKNQRLLTLAQQQSRRDNTSTPSTIPLSSSTGFGNTKARPANLTIAEKKSKAVGNSNEDPSSSPRSSYYSPHFAESDDDQHKSDTLRRRGRPHSEALMIQFQANDPMQLYSYLSRSVLAI